MKNIWSLFYLTMCLTIFSANNAFAEKTNVTIYSDDSYEPYAYEDSNGNNKGIYTKILLKIFDQMPEYRVKILAIPWKRAMSDLESGNVFAVYPPYFRPKERTFIGYYSAPIIEEKIVVYTRLDLLKQARPNWPEDWSGLKIGIFSGTIDIAGTKFKEALENGDLTISETKGNDSNLLKLALGRVDAYVNDEIAILYALSQLRRSGKWNKNFPELGVGAVVNSEQGYLAYSQFDSKYKFSQDFRKKFDAILIKMQKSGEVKRIVDEYLAGNNK